MYEQTEKSEGVKHFPDDEVLFTGRTITVCSVGIDSIALHAWIKKMKWRGCFSVEVLNLNGCVFRREVSSSLAHPHTEQKIFLE